MTALDGNRAVFERHYAADHYRPRADYFTALHELRLELTATVAPGPRILDVGCGGGAVLRPLCDRGLDVTGVDFSAPVLRELAAAAPRARLVQADARALPLPTASFDCAYSFATLYAVPEVERALAEFARVLRPGGRAVLELGNARSLNAVEATRVGNGLRSHHLSPGRMRHLLARCGFCIEQERSFQLFPLWGGGTDRARLLLNPRLQQALAARHGGRLLDEVCSSDAGLADFAFRKLFVVRRLARGELIPGGPSARARDAVLAAPEPDERRAARRRAAELADLGEVDRALDELLALVAADPRDPRPLLAIAGLFDGEEERVVVRRWRRLLTRTGRLPAAGHPHTVAPAGPATPPRRPLVSVVLPTFDAAPLLPEAVQSVFAQSEGDFELIVVDDGSRDDTPRYLRRLDDPRVTVVRQANRRLPAALNRGFALARGEFLTWISADNVCAPTMLRQLVAALRRRPDAVLAAAAFDRVDQRLRHRGRVEDQDLRWRGFLPRNPGLAAFLYRADAAARLAGYAEDLEGAEDWDYWLRLVELGPCVRVDRSLYLYREHARSMTSTIETRIRRASERAFARVLERHGGLPAIERLYPELDGRDPEQRARALLHLGTALLGSPFAAPAIGLSLLQQAVRLAPTSGVAVVQLALGLARSGALAKAAEVARCFGNAADQGLRHLAATIAAAAAGRRTLDPRELPLLPVPEPGQSNPERGAP